MFDDRYIYDNIIPINFYAGTGGTFLCHFIQSAKFNVKKPYNFNKYGSVHVNDKHNWRELEINLHAHSVNASLEEKINRIKTSDFKYIGEEIKTPPFYSTIHAGNISDLKPYFKKMINLYYEKKDSYHLSLIQLLKVFGEAVPTLKISSKQLNENIKNAHNNSRIFCELIDTNICNISWQELFKNNPNILLDKLSKFTNIPENHFYIDNLLAWREKTKKSVFDVFKIII